MKRPTRMSSKEIWNLIFRGPAMESFGYSDYNNKNNHIFSTQQNKHKPDSLEKIRSLFMKIGEYIGLAIVLAIYAGFFYLLSKLIYPLPYKSCIAVSLSLYLVGKILTISIIKYLNRILAFPSMNIHNKIHG